MATVTTKDFQSSNSQAVRLPKAWRRAIPTVQIEKTGRDLLILDPKAETKRVKALAKLSGSGPKFPSVAPLRLPGSCSVCPVFPLS